VDIVIDGLKIGPSNFAEANMIFVLCRTDPTAPKHAGISYVLVPVEVDGRPNGIEFRPIVRMNGKAHFAETFFTGARAPLDNVIGGLNHGWKVAMTTLGSERGGSSTTQHVAFLHDFWDLAEVVRTRGLADDPAVREQLAWAFEHIEVIRYTGLQLIAELAAGHRATTTGNGSAAKIRWSEFQRRFAEISLDLRGPQSLVVGEGYELDRWQDLFLTTRSHTIWGGTAEIQRNIIGERVLGLPKDPRPAEEKGTVR
jgi:alkylation response protein AidB-like acyl-CoA dehydrogenase